jgi:hypothetical protein
MWEITSARRCSVRWRGKRTMLVSLQYALTQQKLTESDVTNLARTGAVDTRETLQL